MLSCDTETKHNKTGEKKMKYTVAQLKKMNSVRLANLVKRAKQSPQSERTKTTLNKAKKVLSTRLS